MSGRPARECARPAGLACPDARVAPIREDDTTGDRGRGVAGGVVAAGRGSSDGVTGGGRVASAAAPAGSNGPGAGSTAVPGGIAGGTAVSSIAGLASLAAFPVTVGAVAGALLGVGVYRGGYRLVYRKGLSAIRRLLQAITAATQ